MAARILRRLRAAQDVEHFANYIAKDSLEAAIRFLECVESTITDLAAAPSMGSRFDSDHPSLTNFRFRRVKMFPNHIVFYVEHQDSIEVVRILHGAQNLDSELMITQTDR